jgi:hypothetical protein
VRRLDGIVNLIDQRDELVYGWGTGSEEAAISMLILNFLAEPEEAVDGTSHLPRRRGGRCSLGPFGEHALFGILRGCAA